MNDPELRQNGLVAVFGIVQHSLNCIEIITAYNGVMMVIVAALWFLSAIFQRPVRSIVFCDGFSCKNVPAVPLVGQHDFPKYVLRA